MESARLGRLLKSPIFVVQKAAAPKNGVEFRHKSIGAIRSSLATLYDDVRRRAMFWTELDFNSILELSIKSNSSINSILEVNYYSILELDYFSTLELNCISILEMN